MCSSWKVEHCSLRNRGSAGRRDPSVVASRKKKPRLEPAEHHSSDELHRRPAAARSSCTCMYARRLVLHSLSSAPPPPSLICRRTLHASPRASAVAMAKKQKQPASAPAQPPIQPLSAFPETGEPEHSKLASWDLWRALGAPKKIVAPMVDGSELAWRVLARRHGADLCYTPMVHSRMYAFRDPNKAKFRETCFNQRLGEEGAHSIDLGRDMPDTDRPLVIQFCGDDPELLLGAANDLAGKCDAVDLNLGCPQGIAKKGHYGSFLQDEWPLIFELINTLHRRCKVPVTAKMRVFPDPERTVAYARMLERAGAQIITVHGRTREMRAQQSGLADWDQIRLVKQSVSVPVVANGNVLLPQDMDDALRATGADAIMAADGHLANPAIFSTSLPVPTPDSQIVAPTPTHPHVIALAREYLAILATLKTPTAGSAVRGHMFRMLNSALSKHTELRPRMGEAAFKSDAEGEARIEELIKVVDELEAKLKEDEQHPETFIKCKKESEETRPAPVSVEANGQAAPPVCNRPVKVGVLPLELYQHLDASSAPRPDHVAHWLAQPYLRYLPPDCGPSLVLAAYRDKTRALIAGQQWPAVDVPPAPSESGVSSDPTVPSDAPAAKRVKIL